jgi:hypothetical protein
MTLIECMDLLEVNAGDIIIRQVQVELLAQGHDRLKFFTRWLFSTAIFAL